jgi:hypothetical protein
MYPFCWHWIPCTPQNTLQTVDLATQDVPLLLALDTLHSTQNTLQTVDLAPQDVTLLLALDTLHTT